MKYARLWLDIPTLTQGNRSAQPQPSDWCGRTSVCMAYNYHQQAIGQPPSSFIVQNQTDATKPYDLIYPDGSVAAPDFLLGEPLNRCDPGWDGEYGANRRELFPVAGRPASVDRARMFDILAPLVGCLERRVPVVIFTGLSNNVSTARHIIVISGYRRDADDDVWLLVDDPSPVGHLTGSKAGATKVRNVGSHNIELVGRGSGPALGSGQWFVAGARYWLRASRLFEPNTTSNDPSDLWCDHCDRKGLRAIIPPDLVIPDSPFFHAESGYELPVDLGQGRQLTEAVAQAAFAHTEAGEAGFYPIGANTLWHGGVHLRADAGAEVRACAAGTVVAARLDDEGPVGSRSFVLVRHDGDLGVAPWWSLYMHLLPVATDETDRLRQLAWLRRPSWPKDPGPPPPGGDPALTYDSSGQFIIGGPPGTNVSNSFTVAEFLTGGRLCVHRELVAAIQAVRTALDAGMSIVWVDASGLDAVVSGPRELLATARAEVRLRRVDPVASDFVFVSLRTEAESVGELDAGLVGALDDGIVTPGRRVAAGDLLGWVGAFGEPTPLDQVHWEVFSEQPLVPTLLPGLADGWTEVDDDDDDLTLDPARVFDLVEQSRATWDRESGWDPLKSTLQRAEVVAFYRSGAAAEVRRVACKFRSEWALDLEAALDDMGVWGWVTDELRETVPPYLWWNELEDEGRTDDLPGSKHVWHYNPIAVLPVLAARATGEEGEPAPVDPVEPEVQASAGVWHTIARGEYLSLISLNYYGDAMRWREIYDHSMNAELRALRPDPDVVEPGDRVYVPGVDAPVA